MATPLAAGAATMLLAAAQVRGRAVGYLEVKRALLASVDPFPDGRKYVST
jgi:hypothetical protein